MPRRAREREWTRRRVVLLGVVLGLVVAADQGTKYWAVAHLTNAFDRSSARSFTERVIAFYTLKNLDNEPPETGGVDRRRAAAVVVPGFWRHGYVENPGAAWGLLAGASERWRVPFFHVLSVLAIGVLLGMYRRLQGDQVRMAWALSMVLGGALGNFVDRIARGYVIDFIDWHWGNRPDLHWPTFNVADAAICVGVFLMVVDTLVARRPEAMRQAHRPGPQAAEPDTRGMDPGSLPPPDPASSSETAAPPGRAPE